MQSSSVLGEELALELAPRLSKLREERMEEMGRACGKGHK